ncbi:hypothetical protein [Blastococcus sp. VKM Ac-2987]|uniref:hypothetical protein n=1 Tax=Blastococcus sp. VKM Ac-2987 TaxID=3004141 RepID=UPI0022AB9892|nr:hypothetical protein [Blastococcus sp. VKM Ac-2987]MCZ2859287.1 hypothetical protein [Blastococcus sp. VKM Ac-2987]
MEPGGVLVDISIDQGGCFEDSRPTTHAAPTSPVHRSLGCCVASLPGSDPSMSTRALTVATPRHDLRRPARTPVGRWRRARSRPPGQRRRRCPRRRSHRGGAPAAGFSEVLDT